MASYVPGNLLRQTARSSPGGMGFRCSERRPTRPGPYGARAAERPDRSLPAAPLRKGWGGESRSQPSLVDGWLR